MHESVIQNTVAGTQKNQTPNKIFKKPIYQLHSTFSIPVDVNIFPELDHCALGPDVFPF